MKIMQKKDKLCSGYWPLSTIVIIFSVYVALLEHFWIFHRKWKKNGTAEWIGTRLMRRNLKLFSLFFFSGIACECALDVNSGIVELEYLLFQRHMTTGSRRPLVTICGGGTGIRQSTRYHVVCCNRIISKINDGNNNPSLYIIYINCLICLSGKCCGAFSIPFHTEFSHLTS